MTEGKDKQPRKDDERAVVDGLLSEMGVDDEMRRELIASGRLTGDVFKVESSEEVRRRIEIEKSLDRLRDSLNLVERSVSSIESAIDKIERDLIPVVLSFLVGLKGNLVTLRGTVIDKSKRRAKTNLQASFVESEVRGVVEDEFVRVEETLTSGMSAPILERLRDITEGLRAATKASFTELAALKASVDDLAQRSTTEVEYLSKELSMKPRVEVPKAVEEKMKSLERKVEELTRDLTISEQTLANRDSELASARESADRERAKSESLEETIAHMSAAPTADPGAITELRQNIKALEATVELLNGKLEEANRRADEAEDKRHMAVTAATAQGIEIDDLKTRIAELEADLIGAEQSVVEMDQLRARIRSYESGDMVREYERMKGEMDRIASHNARLTAEFESNKARLAATEFRLNGYLGLMQSTEKTKAFMMVEEAGEVAVREIGRSLGVSPGSVLKWAEDFQRLGIARLTENQTVKLTKYDEKSE